MQRLGVLTTLAIATALSACMTDRAAAPRAFERFVEEWPGDYDNREQKAPYLPTRLHLRRVELPAFGKHVIYAEWVHAADNRVLRQRIYAFSVDPDGRWRLALHIWPADRPEFVARTSGAWKDAARLNDVTPADMAGLQGCDVLFAPSDAQTREGQMVRGACRIPAPGIDREVYSWTRMRRSTDRFEYRDGWYFASDDAPWREFSPDWYDFRRTAPSPP